GSARRPRGSRSGATRAPAAGRFRQHPTSEVRPIDGGDPRRPPGRVVRLYLDTSAAMKLLIDEAESESLAAQLDALDSADRLVSSWLLHTELHCGVGRRPEILSAE